MPVILSLFITRDQARRQDLAAGGTKNQKEGPKPRKVGHIFKILYWMYAATREPTVKWGGKNFKWGGRAPLAPPLATNLPGTYTLGVRRTRNQTDSDVTCSRSCDQGKILKKV